METEIPPFILYVERITEYYNEMYQHLQNRRTLLFYLSSQHKIIRRELKALHAGRMCDHALLCEAFLHLIPIFEKDPFFKEYIPAFSAFVSNIEAEMEKVKKPRKAARKAARKT